MLRGISPSPSSHQGTPSRLSSQDERLRTSFSEIGGLSFEEVTRDEIDDILPKTEYTYARTASYSPKFLRQKRYRSPNMSRRRVHGALPSFISDDEDDFEEDMDNEAVMTSNVRLVLPDDQISRGSSSDYTDSLGVPQHRGRARGRSLAFTSTPITPHDDHHISTHDHYYDGMLLRSGSHVHGAERYHGGGGVVLSRRSEGNLAPLSQAALISDEEMSKASMARRRSGRNTTTVTTITTTTTTEEEEEAERAKKKLLMEEEDSERKLRLDESQTEKLQYLSGRDQYRLKHLDGLDYDDDISDVDGHDVLDSHFSTQHTTDYISTKRKRWSVFTFFTTIITTIVTTVTTTISENSSNVVKSVASAVAAPVVIPARWTLHALASSCSWLVKKSAALLLLDIEMKQRRRRGCCCCLLPFLLLLPLLLLGGYYGKTMQQDATVYWSRSRTVFAESWNSLWITSKSENIPVYQPPAPVPVAVTEPPAPPPEPVVVAPQVDMDALYQYIQNTVVHVTSANKDDRPVGLTEDQVRAIVLAMLRPEVDGVKDGVGENLASLQGLLREDISKLEAKLSAVQQEIQVTSEAHQAMTDNFDQTRMSFEGSVEDQRTQWQASVAALEGKLASLQGQMDGLTSQNAALSAMLGKCCQNNSVVTTDSVRAHVLAVMSQMGSDDEDRQHLAGLMSWLNGQYVEKSELDHRLSAVSAEIMESLRVLLADRGEHQASEVAVKSIIDEALIQFSADRIGMPDFALESAGGSILSVRCSETYYRKTALVSVFGFPLWYTSNSPRTVIQPNVHPGECWAFKGTSGYLVIQLSHPVQPTGFTLEHIPRSLAPKGKIDSAPKNFAVFGLVSESDTQGLSLGNYTYLDNGKPIQFFSIQNGHPGVFQHVELRVLDNHGNQEYTCVYRFRVHGML
ncbi:SUN domain-containing protein 1 isoform X2 [Aplysia californica]|uniref:SUN domain-containing protein 1 isoform X2 n=1 Tax=Aplysia californica TaxID=6500 RepID=A0ABM1VPD1_APLCA|nr:SUN domain-containing protein 1 isoform X2 [Aplysia californica]